MSSKKSPLSPLNKLKPIVKATSAQTGVSFDLSTLKNSFTFLRDSSGVTFLSKIS